MRVKTFTSIFEKRLDLKINEFIDDLDKNNFEVENIKFSSSIFYMSAMVIYKEL